MSAILFRLQYVKDRYTYGWICINEKSTTHNFSKLNRLVSHMYASELCIIG